MCVVCPCTNSCILSEIRTELSQFFFLVAKCVQFQSFFVSLNEYRFVPSLYWATLEPNKNLQVQFRHRNFVLKLSITLITSLPMKKARNRAIREQRDLWFSLPPPCWPEGPKSPPPFMKNNHPFLLPAVYGDCWWQRSRSILYIYFGLWSNLQFRNARAPTHWYDVLSWSRGLLETRGLPELANTVSENLRATLCGFEQAIHSTHIDSI